MERKTIEVPAQSDSVDARIQVEQFDGKVQLCIEHDFATASIVIDTHGQLVDTIHALQAHSDDLTWKRADAIVRERHVTAKSWRAQWNAYDDMNGGDWSLWQLQFEGEARVLEIAASGSPYNDETCELVNNALCDIWDQPIEGSWIDGEWRELPPVE
jgi:hypothetical protein